MSQKKVDAYKAEKAKRKETIENQKKKDKIRSMSTKIALLAVAALIVVALVFTGINAYKSHKNSLPTYDVSNYSINDYAGLLSEDEDEHDHDHEDESEEETESESAAETEADTTAAP
ncbi:MAG: hypothetical protein J5865_00350 [Lachnospiraceae bacterium]|nr:hypothetical protein [Lachnospiraceae bacterium]